MIDLTFDAYARQLSVLAKENRQKGEPPSIACPVCGMTSFHPKDIEERYCAACHNWHSEMVKPA
jgi:ribosomal protein L37E